MGTLTAAILGEMAEHRQRFEDFCRSLSQEELATMVPDSPWTVHGYIAHLCTIDALLCRFFGPLVGIGDMPRPDVPPPVPFDIDDWNEAIVALRPTATIEELLSEGALHRANYQRILGTLNDAALEMMIPFGGDRKVIDLPATTVRLEDLLWSIALHDPRHTQDIIRALSQREPDVREWLASVPFDRVPAAINDRRI